MVFFSAVIAVFYQCLTMMRKGIHNGQTFGKQALNITVVRENNQSANFFRVTPPLKNFLVN
jgi:hypothetical protein